MSKHTKNTGINNQELNEIRSDIIDSIYNNRDMLSIKAVITGEAAVRYNYKGTLQQYETSSQSRITDVDILVDDTDEITDIELYSQTEHLVQEWMEYIVIENDAKMKIKSKKEENTRNLSREHRIYVERNDKKYNILKVNVHIKKEESLLMSQLYSYKSSNEKIDWHSPIGRHAETELLRRNEEAKKNTAITGNVIGIRDEKDIRTLHINNNDKLEVQTVEDAVMFYIYKLNNEAKRLFRGINVDISACDISNIELSLEKLRAIVTNICCNDDYCWNVSDSRIDKVKICRTVLYYLNKEMAEMIRHITINKQSSKVMDIISKITYTVEDKGITRMRNTIVVKQTQKKPSGNKREAIEGMRCIVKIQDGDKDEKNYQIHMGKRNIVTV